MLQAMQSNPENLEGSAKRIVSDMEGDIREALSCAWLLYDRLSKRGAMGGGTQGDAYCMIAGNLLGAAQKTSEAYYRLVDAIEEIKDGERT